MEVKNGWFGYAVVVLVLHMAGAYGLIVSSGENPGLWGIGLLAYTLGLRHAFDVDHIAAIDNTVRKLVQERRNPLGVGFYFSLGHSSVVFLLALATAFSAHWVEREKPELQALGSVIGAVVSGSFLLIIGLMNLMIFLRLTALFRRFRNEDDGRNADEFERLLEERGLFARILRPFYRLIRRSWHVFPLGFLFGLGFDTASEVSLLTLSAGAGRDALPLAGILAFPLLFAAGMSVMDTADGIFMTKAYRWALSTPLRKLYYNLSVTAIAVGAALLIGLLELGQVLSDQFGWSGGLWDFLQTVTFEWMGYALVALFLLAWLASVAVWKGMKLEKKGGAFDAEG